MANCPDCNSKEVYKSKRSVPTSGGYGPNLLPGFHTFSGTNMIAIVCTDCGLIRHYAGEKARNKIKASKKWERA